MEKKCPRCGKIVVVSQEEIAMRDGVVVCPQCLAMFDTDGSLHVSSDTGLSRASQPLTADSATQQAHYCYCPDCGKPLPADVNFCPYCGISLKNLTKTTPSPAVAVAQPIVQAEPVVAQPVAMGAAIETGVPVTEAPSWVPVYPTYHYRKHKWGHGPASLRTRIAAYIIIAALLILFVFIVYQGMLISD